MYRTELDAFKRSVKMISTCVQQHLVKYTGSWVLTLGHRTAHATWHACTLFNCKYLYFRVTFVAVEVDTTTYSHSLLHFVRVKSVCSKNLTSNQWQAIVPKRMRRGYGWTQNCLSYVSKHGTSLIVEKTSAQACILLVLGQRWTVN